MKDNTFMLAFIFMRHKILLWKWLLTTEKLTLLGRLRTTKSPLFKIQIQPKQTVRDIAYVCTERIFDGRPFMCIKIFLKNLI